MKILVPQISANIYGYLPAPSRNEVHFVIVNEYSEPKDLSADGCVSLSPLSSSSSTCVSISLTWLISGITELWDSTTYSRVGVGSGAVLGIPRCRDALGIPGWICRQSCGHRATPSCLPKYLTKGTQIC